MDRQHIVSLLRDRQSEIVATFNVKSLGLFGSAAREELHEASDIDILVAFNGPATYDNYMNLKFYLERLFHRPVDLVTERAIKPRLRAVIEKDLIHVS